MEKISRQGNRRSQYVRLMNDNGSVGMSEEEIVVQLVVQPKKKIGLSKVIWRELTAGVGLWGSIRPLVAVLLAAIPLLFLGQHFNRQHRKAGDWTLLQIPLAFTVILWFGIYLWSLVDAWQVSSNRVATIRNKRLGI